jgi:hypothetical protein
MTGAASTAGVPGAWLRGAAWLALALLVVIMAASAFLRLAQGDAALEGAIELARGIHRAAATIAFIVIAGVAVFGWDELRPLAASRIVLAAQLGLAIALAFLGRFTPSEHPLVALGNPLGGLAMIGLAWWLVLAASPVGATRPPRTLLGIAMVAAAHAAVAAIVVASPPLALGLALQLAAAALLVAGVTLARPRDR